MYTVVIENTINMNQLSITLIELNLLNFKMKKKDIIQLVKDIINEIGADAYGDATLTSQGQSKSRFTKTGRPPGVMDEEMTALGYPKGFIPTADKFHQELVGRDTDREFKRIKDDPRSGMSIFAFPYMEAPPSPSLFGRETRMALEASKARAKEAAQKTVDAFICQFPSSLCEVFIPFNKTIVFLPLVSEAFAKNDN